MKKLILILAISLLIAGCKTTKKITTSEIQTSKAVETTQKIVSVEKQNVDNNKKSNQETTTVKITFLPPDPDKPNPPTDSPTTGIPEVDKQIQSQNLTNHGAIGSIEISTTKSSDSDQSKIQTEKNGQTETATKANEDTATKSVVTEKKKPDRRWMWIFAIPVIVVVAAIIRYRDKFKSVLSWAGKILKI